MYDKETGRLAQYGLPQQVQNWPTPNAGPQNDSDTTWPQRREELKEKWGNNGFGLTLGMAATNWPTPRAAVDHMGLPRQNERGELPLYLPGPNDHAGWEWLLARWPGLAPTYCKEGHDVQPEMPTTQRDIRGASHGAPTGVDRRLRAVGNGVVPAVSAKAFRELARRLEHSSIR